MTPTKTTNKSNEKSLVVPLVVVVLVLLVIGLGVMISKNMQRANPLYTAAAPSGHPGVYLTASPEKSAKEQAIQQRMNAQIYAIKNSSH